MNQIKTSPKDFFLHLGATIALYVGVIALINLFFTVINYYFPDALAGDYFSSSIAWPVSILIVVTPIIYFIEWLINKDIKLIPEKAGIWIRKWRIYLTLFIGAIVIAGDLITLINTYLNGEISIRFVYKFLVILIITSIVFTYYIFDWINKYFKIKILLSYLGLIVALIGIILGFVIVGSPTKQRSIRFDNQRIADLQNIQWQIINYWQQKGKLPIKLDDVNDPISNSVVPVDPETNEVYEYNVKNPTTFELCAIFDLDQQEIKGRGPYGHGGTSVFRDIAYPMVPENVNWMHSSGRVCFERVIDIDKYPIIKK